MNKLILLLFFISIFLLFYEFQQDKNSKPNQLEQLLSSIPNTENYFKPNEKVYLISSPSSDEMLYQIQFALAPLVVVKAHQNLPENSSLLMVKDLKSASKNIVLDSFAKERESLLSVTDTNFSIALFKIK